MIRTALRSAPAVRLATVSPYAAFLQDTRSKLPECTGTERAYTCAAAWHELTPAKKQKYVSKAANMPPFPIEASKPRRPPPFGRWCKRHWSAAPAALDFEEKVMWLAKYFHRQWISPKTGLRSKQRQTELKAAGRKNKA